MIGKSILDIRCGVEEKEEGEIEEGEDIFRIEKGESKLDRIENFFAIILLTCTCRWESVMDEEIAMDKRLLSTLEN